MLRWSRWVTVTSTLALIATSVVAIAAVSGKKAGVRDKQVERGLYLSVLMGCGDCHTPGYLYGAPDHERHLSGSELGWTGPWGVSFPRNLTPDMETGLGKWSEREIVTALRTGTRPDGSTLLPPMPWQNFTVMTDADAYALAAYLKSLKPVRHEMPRTVPPGEKYDGATIVMPPPPAWDVPPPAGQ